MGEVRLARLEERVLQLERYEVVAGVARGLVRQRLGLPEQPRDVVEEPVHGGAPAF